MGDEQTKFPILYYMVTPAIIQQLNPITIIQQLDEAQLSNSDPHFLTELGDSEPSCMPEPQASSSAP